VLRKILSSTTTLLLLCAVLLLTAFVGRVASRTTIVRLGYELSTQNARHERLSTELNALRTELAARRSPDALAREGKARFGLDAPRAEQIVTVTTRGVR
jgi:outer membrane murein-binding lipoprotein Lpp